MEKENIGWTEWETRKLNKEGRRESEEGGEGWRKGGIDKSEEGKEVREREKG